jgi:hypothetical protein
VQSQDHLRRVLRSELQPDKRKVRSYKSEYWIDGIRICGRSHLGGLPVEIGVASTRKRILRMDAYENTENSDRAEENYVLYPVAAPYDEAIAARGRYWFPYLQELVTHGSMLKAFVCSSVPLWSGDGARGIKCGE